MVICVKHRWKLYVLFLYLLKDSLVSQLVKNPPAMQEAQVQPLGQEDPLEKRQATHSSILGLPWQLSW